MKAPAFSLPDQEGTIRSLADYKGQWVVLYFYPKDDTPGCTKQACGLRDAQKEFAALRVAILGMSKDTVQSHKKFAEKYHLTFPLLSDTSADTIKAYGAWGEKTFMGRTFSGIHRNTYLIDPEGTVAKTYNNVNPLTHTGMILKDLTELASK